MLVVVKVLFRRLNVIILYQNYMLSQKVEEKLISNIWPSRRALTLRRCLFEGNFHSSRKCADKGHALTIFPPVEGSFCTSEVVRRRVCFSAFQPQRSFRSAENIDKCLKYTSRL